MKKISNIKNILTLFDKLDVESRGIRKAFTLVELIIVITILTVLATIAFVSFQNYTKSARDSNRVATLTQVEKGLDIYSVQVGNLPTPEKSKTFTGGINSEIKQGILTKSVLQTLGTTPIDPVSGKEYTYSIFGNGKYYQVGANLENTISQKISQQAYANTFKTVKLIGNYKYDPSLPSLIIGSGSNIFSPDTCFLINGGTDTLENCQNAKSNMLFNVYDKGLLAYYDMETQSNLGLIDKSGNNNTGTGLGGLGFQESDFQNGIIGKSLILNGTTKVYIPNFKMQENGTVTAITTSLSYPDGRGVQRVFHNGDGDGNGGQRELNFGYGNSSTGKVVSGFIGSLDINSATYKYNHINTVNENAIKGIKNHIAMTYSNGSKIKLFLNGRLIGEQSMPTLDFGVIANRSYIGGAYGGARTLYGDIDEVKIYNRALTDEEVFQQARIAGF